MIKIKQLYLILAILFLIIGCNTENTPNDDKEIRENIATVNVSVNVEIPDNLYGDWLSKDYVDKIIKYKSSKEANKSHENPLLFRFTKKDHEMFMLTASNFHLAEWGMSGGRLIDFEKINDTYIAKVNNYDNYPAVIHMIDYSNIILDIKGYSDYKPQHMIKADGGFEKLIARILLVGNYISETNESYYFSENDLATLPRTDKEFTYSVVAASYGENGFRDETNKKYYGFEWKENKLYIYDQGEDTGESFYIKDNPIILTKVD